MKRRTLIGGAAAVAVIAATGYGGWLLSLPGNADDSNPEPIGADEHAAAVNALKRPAKRDGPVVAIIGINDATETTDYIMPYGILKRSGVAEVVSLATGPGTVTLFPALSVQPDMTTSEFDAAHPQGADYVIVPAMSRDDDPVALAWLRQQAQNGAMIIGVCAGAKVVAEAGLLGQKNGTTHWYYLDELRKRHPSMNYVADRRYVIEQDVATTTGITASMPMMLTLIEAIAGRDEAAETAQNLGVTAWDARHESGAFKLTRPFALTVMGNVMAFWRREEFGIRLDPALDEVSLALVADAWSRTYRSRARTFSETPDVVSTRNGVRVVPDQVASDWTPDRLVEVDARAPSVVLDDTLAAIARRYGEGTRKVVAAQLEYPT